MNIPLVRHTVRISVLSCKGGSGASLISSHLANEIVTNKKVPVLLAQGLMVLKIWILPLIKNCKAISLSILTI